MGSCGGGEDVIIECQKKAKRDNGVLFLKCVLFTDWVIEVNNKQINNSLYQVLV